MDIVWKGIIGGIVTAIIAAAAKKGNVLPGIIPLFPTFAIIALYIIGMNQKASGFQETCIAGLKSIPAYMAFLIACYFIIEKLGYRATLVLGLLFWLLAVAAVFLGPRYFTFLSR